MELLVELFSYSKGSVPLVLLFLLSVLECIVTSFPCILIFCLSLAASDLVGFEIVYRKFVAAEI